MDFAFLLGTHLGQSGRVWSTFRYMLKVELVGYVDGLGVKYEEKRGVKDDSDFWAEELEGRSCHHQEREGRQQVSSCGSSILETFHFRCDNS